MQSIRRSAGTLAVAVFFALFVWLWEHWLDLNSAPLNIPLQAKMAFAVALALLGARFHLVAYCLRADTRKDWLQRAAVWGSLWYIWMALMTDTVLPGPDAWPHLIVSVGFGLFMGYRPPRQEIADLPIPSAIQPWLLIGLVTAIFALSLLSFSDQPGWVFFCMIIAVTLASPGGQSWAAIKWHEWGILALGTVALMMGYFIARGTMAPFG